MICGGGPVDGSGAQARAFARWTTFQDISPPISGLSIGGVEDQLAATIYAAGSFDFNFDISR